MFIGKEGVSLVTEEEFKEILDKEETDTVEFKSWINARNMKEIISLAVDELIAFANTKGGTVYFGVEDKPIEVTGCDRNYDGQRIIEGFMIELCHHYLQKYQTSSIKENSLLQYQLKQMERHIPLQMADV